MKKVPDPAGQKSRSGSSPLLISRHLRDGMEKERIKVFSGPLCLILKDAYVFHDQIQIYIRYLSDNSAGGNTNIFYLLNII